MTTRGWSVVRVGRHQLDVIVLAILVAALALRVYLASTLRTLSLVAAALALSVVSSLGWVSI